MLLRSQPNGNVQIWMRVKIAIKIEISKNNWIWFCTYSRSVSGGIRLGTCCRSRCEQSTVCPVQVQTRGHFRSMLLLPMPKLLEPPKFVPWMKMPTPLALLYGSALPSLANSTIANRTMAHRRISGGFLIIIDIFLCSYVVCPECTVLKCQWFAVMDANANGKRTKSSIQRSAVFAPLGFTFTIVFLFFGRSETSHSICVLLSHQRCTKTSTNSWTMSSNFFCFQMSILCCCRWCADAFNISLLLF